MKNFLDTLRLFYYAPPGDDGAGGSKKLTPEQLTDQKLGDATIDEPDGDGGGGADDPPANPDNPDGGDDGGSPDKKEEPAGGGEEPPAGDDPDGDGGDPAGGADDGSGGGEETFYDPEVHVEGKAAHSNTFPTRDKAEYAAIQKAEMLRDKLNEMDEDGVDRGAIPLPKALQGDPKAIERFMSLESVHEMEDDALRGFLNETDASRQRLDSKHTRVKGEKKKREAENEFEQLQIDLYDDLKGFMDDGEIKSNLNNFGSLEQGREFINEKINSKVKAELEDDRQDLESWIDKVDSGEINLSVREFDKQKQQKVDAIAAKERELREQYEPATNKFERAFELSEQVDSSAEQSPEQVAKTMWSSFDEMQKDLGGGQSGNADLEILADTPTARAELSAAKNWAVQNRADYNNLQHPSDWARALRDGWPSHKDKIRAGKQRKDIEGDSKDEKGGADDGIPKPGNQGKLAGIEDRNVGSMNNKRLDKLEQMTDAKVG